MKTKLIFLIPSIVLIIVLPVNALVTYDFKCITINDPTFAAIGENQMFMDVSDPGGGQVSFNFRNTGPQPSTLTDIFFADDTTDLGSMDSIINGTGVNMFQYSLLPNLPGGLVITPQFIVTSGLSAGIETPVSFTGGVDPGENVDILFNLDPIKQYSDVINDLNAGTFRVGIYLQGFDPDFPCLFDESFINKPGITIPAPGALLLGSIGIALVSWVRRRFA